MPSATAKRIAAECIAARLRVLNRLVTQRCDAGLRPFGLRTSQVNVLVVIAVNGPVPPATVADVLAMDKSTLSRDLDRLIENGWVTATASETDKRAKVLAITAEGEAMIDKIGPAWVAGQRDVRKLLGDAADPIVAVVNARWGMA